MEHTTLNRKGFSVQSFGFIILLFVLLFAAVTAVSSLSYSVAMALVKPSRSVDPYGCFLLVSVHHIVQAVLALLLMLLQRKARMST